MKARLRISTDQFEFIEADYDGTPEQIVDAYRELKRMVLPQTGLADKEWRAAVDEYLNTGTLKNGTELYQAMNERQQWFFQTIKKANKRLKITE